MFTKVLAHTILLAAQIHEESYRKCCFDKATKEAEQKAAADPKDPAGAQPDPKEFYAVDIPTAAKIACGLNGVSASHGLIELLLTSSWNESIDLAKSLVEPPKPPMELKDLMNMFFGSQ